MTEFMTHSKQRKVKKQVNYKYNVLVTINIQNLVIKLSPIYDLQIRPLILIKNFVNFKFSSR